MSPRAHDLNRAYVAGKAHALKGLAAFGPFSAPGRNVAMRRRWFRGYRAGVRLRGERMRANMASAMTALAQAANGAARAMREIAKVLR